MIFRLLQMSLCTTLASERPSAIHELLPDSQPASLPARGHGLVTAGALVIGLLGVALFLATAAQLFCGGAKTEATLVESPSVPQKVSTMQPPDSKSMLMAYAAEHAGKATAGKLVFASKGCLACHDQPGAGGGMGPDLLGVGTRYSHEMLMKKILSPRVKSGMPTTFANDLSPAEFVDLLAYLQDAKPVSGNVQ